jgi:hypothetical protein
MRAAPPEPGGGDAALLGRRSREVYRVYAEDELLGADDPEAGGEAVPEGLASAGGGGPQAIDPGGWSGRQRRGPSTARAVAGTALACALGLVVGFAAVQAVRELGTGSGGHAPAEGSGARVRSGPARGVAASLAGSGPTRNGARSPLRAAPRRAAARGGAGRVRPAMSRLRSDAPGAGVPGVAGDASGGEVPAGAESLSGGSRGEAPPAPAGAPLGALREGGGGGEIEFGFER